MSDFPWLSIIGLGEDGVDGLTTASLDTLGAASTIIGPPRHLALLPDLAGERIEWPVPFAEGIDLVMSRSGQPTVVLASGDPFWFGAGAVLARRLSRDEWQAFPGRSTFSLAAARLGWPLEATLTFGLHAAPLSRLRPYLAPGRKLIVLVRDGAAAGDLAAYLDREGFGASALTLLQSLGGPRERISAISADAPFPDTAAHPIAVAVEVAGEGRALPLSAGRPDEWFDNDGQITKRPVRALTLSALAPSAYEHLWDIGGGSGSIAIEWLLADPTLTATSIEPRPQRAERIKENAYKLGVDRLKVVTGQAPEALHDLALPDVVFIGGGLDQCLIDWLVGNLAPGTRLVANAVTLETDALLVTAQGAIGGSLMRVDLSSVSPIGEKRGWKAAYPITQWSVTL